jgi:hypothetical protein
LRCALEKALSSDLSSVRLRTNAALEDLGALACVQGEDVYLSPSAPALATPAGVAVLGHELAHVLQQRAGRVRVRAGSLIVEDEALEREADRIGLHCAAQLFPGFLIDPGIPAAARGWSRLAPGSEPAPIQFLIPSTVSFNAVVTYVYNYCGGPWVNRLSVSHILNDIYDYAADYNPNNVPAKVALAGPVLYGQMAAFIQATAPCRIEMQKGWLDITAQRTAFDNYYLAVANGNQPPPDPDADDLTQTYLHVYPNVQADADWRIGLNVLPSDMAPAAAALVPLLANNYASMDHMKFMSPGYAGKADSVIVYCDRTANDYQQLRTDVLNAAAALNFQQRVGAMWDEVQPGIGLASEPPMSGVSFTEYRCMILYLAYWSYRALERPAPSLADFRLYLANVALGFGVNVASPHNQGPLQRQDPDFPQWWRALKALSRAWRR